jgi:hypothetical protein
MAWIRRLISFALTLGIILGLLIYAPRWRVDHLAPDFTDIDGLDPEARFVSDRGVPFAALAAGDAILFRSGAHLAVGWVAAVAGDAVAIRGQQVMVGGKPARGGPVARPDTPEVVVPQGRLYVVSDRHLTDSVANGFLPAVAYLGTLRSLP